MDRDKHEGTKEEKKNEQKRITDGFKELSFDTRHK